MICPTALIFGHYDSHLYLSSREWSSPEISQPLQLVKRFCRATRVSRAEGWGSHFRLPLLRPCSLSQSKTAIANLKFRVYIKNIYSTDSRKDVFRLCAGRLPRGRQLGLETISWLLQGCPRRSARVPAISDRDFNPIEFADYSSRRGERSRIDACTGGKLTFRLWIYHSEHVPRLLNPGLRLRIAMSH